MTVFPLLFDWLSLIESRVSLACFPPITAMLAVGQAKISRGSYAFPHIA